MIVICIFLVLNIALSVLFIRPLVKPLAIVFCLLNASALYFMNAYGVVIDKIMLMNVIQTDVYEVADLLNLKMALYLILLGIIPSYLIYKTDIAFKPLKADAKGKLTQGLIFALVAGGIIGGGLLHNPGTLKEHKHLKNALIPVNYIGAVISVVKIKAKYWGIELKTISEGARMLPQKEGSKPALIVVVIGESARDASFPFRDTNGRPTNRSQNMRTNWSTLTIFIPAALPPPFPCPASFPLTRAKIRAGKRKIHRKRARRHQPRRLQTAVAGKQHRLQGQLQPH